MLPRIRPGKLEHELLVRASKNKDFDAPTPLAFDLTAGLGEDSIILAAAGFKVRMYERDPLIGALLEDSLSRIKNVASLLSHSSSSSSHSPASPFSPHSFDSLSLPSSITDEDVTILTECASRMSVRLEDSINALSSPLTERPDIVLLDPMFPEKQKNSLSKKKLQILQMISPPCPDENELLHAALSARPKKIIIKRPLKGPFLGGKTPTYSISGKLIRFDCIVL